MIDMTVGQIILVVTCGLPKLSSAQQVTPVWWGFFLILSVRDD